MIHTSYQEYQTRTGELFWEREREFGSVLGRFVCWVRNVDAEEASRAGKVGRVAVAVLAVVAMIVTTPLVVGGILLIKFISLSKRVSSVVDLVEAEEKERRKSEESHRALVEALGGEEACSRIPVVDRLDAYDYLDMAFRGNPPLAYTFSEQHVQEIFEAFEANRTASFQMGGNFVALLIENLANYERTAITAFKVGSCRDWKFCQLSRTSTLRMPIMSPISSPRVNIETIRQIVSGFHPLYGLVNGAR